MSGRKIILVVITLALVSTWSSEVFAGGGRLGGVVISPGTSVQAQISPMVSGVVFTPLPSTSTSPSDESALLDGLDSRRSVIVLLILAAIIAGLLWAARRNTGAPPATPGT